MSEMWHRILRTKRESGEKLKELLSLIKKTLMFFLRGLTEMRMREEAKARGICPWCQALISSRHQAVEVCSNCPDFGEDQVLQVRRPSEGKKTYLHVKCSMQAGCKRCEKGEVIRVQ